MMGAALTSRGDYGAQSMVEETAVRGALTNVKCVECLGDPDHWNWAQNLLQDVGASRPTHVIGKRRVRTTTASAAVFAQVPRPFRALLASMLTLCFDSASSYTEHENIFCQYFFERNNKLL